MLSFDEYLDYFQSIINSQQPEAPYDQEEYFHYTKMNLTRTNRWLKKGVILPEITAQLASIREPIEWIVITEPWCGDAAQCVPFFHLMAAKNPLISLKIVLRDQPPYLIDQYLTNGTKSIPLLIIRNAAGEDLAVWGPRPAGAKELFLSMKAADQPFEDIKEALQKWYNQDAGKEIQEEIIKLIL